MRTRYRACIPDRPPSPSRAIRERRKKTGRKWGRHARRPGVHTSLYAGGEQLIIVPRTRVRVTYARASRARTAHHPSPYISRVDVFFFSFTAPLAILALLAGRTLFLIFFLLTDTAGVKGYFLKSDLKHSSAGTRKARMEISSKFLFDVYLVKGRRRFKDRCTFFFFFFLLKECECSTNYSCSLWLIAVSLFFQFKIIYVGLLL